MEKISRRDQFNKDLAKGVSVAGNLDVASDMPSVAGVQAALGAAATGRFTVHQGDSNVSAIMGATGSVQGLFSGIGRIFTAKKNLDADAIRKDYAGVMLTLMQNAARGWIKVAQFMNTSASAALSAIATLGHNLNAQAMQIAGKITNVAGSVLRVASGMLLAIPTMISSVFTFGLAAELNKNVKKEVNSETVSIKPALLKDLLKRLNAKKDSMTFMDTVLNPPLTKKENAHLISLGYKGDTDAKKITFIEEIIVFATKKNFKRLLLDKAARKTIGRIAKEMPAEFKKLNSKELTAADVKNVETFLLKRGAIKLALATAAIASVTIAIIATVATGGTALAIGAAVAGLVMSGVWIGVDGKFFVDSFKSITADNGSTTDKVLKGILVATTVLSILGTIALTVATGGVGAAVVFAVIGSIIAATSGSFAAASLAKSSILEFNAMKAKLALIKFAKGEIKADSYTVLDTEKYLSMMNMYLKTSSPELDQLKELMKMTKDLKASLEPSFAKGFNLLNMDRDFDRNAKVSKKLTKLIKSTEKAYKKKEASLIKKELTEKLTNIKKKKAATLLQRTVRARAAEKRAKVATLIQKRVRGMRARKKQVQDAIVKSRVDMNAQVDLDTANLEALTKMKEVIFDVEKEFDYSPNIDWNELEEIVQVALFSGKTSDEAKKIAMERAEEMQGAKRFEEIENNAKSLRNRVESSPDFRKAKKKVNRLNAKWLATSSEKNEAACVKAQYDLNAVQARLIREAQEG